MYDFTYDNQGTNTYLVYQVGENDELDSLSLGMITNNRILGLAPTVYTQMDSAKYIKYNVSAKISVKQFFTGPVNKRRLLGVFNGIVAAMLSAEDYMIDDRMILLDTEYIFADVSTCETVLICLPIQNEAETTDLGAFFKNIMFNTQFDQTENCDYVARIMNHLNSTPIFSLSQFKSVLDELNGQVSVRPATSAPTVSEATLVQQQQAKRLVAPSSVEVKQQTPVTPIQTSVAQPVVSQQSVTPAVNVPPTVKSVQNVPPIVKQPETQQPTSDEKEISLFYLLQHYNSENAAAYKAQKEAKKNGTASSATSTAVPTGMKEKASGKKKGQPQPVSTGFAIPGQATPVNQLVQPQNQKYAQPVQPIQPAQPVRPVQSPITPIPVTPQPPAQTPVTPRPVQPSGVNFGETTVLGGGVAGETTVLTAGATATKQVNPHLIRAKNNEKIPVNKPVFRIGKEKSYVDYFIGDNTAISRSHANIITREEKYFVLDTNSTNHTFVDGKMIPSSAEVEITHGTKLRFANEDFEFQLY